MLRQYNISIKCMLAILLSALFASCKDEIEEEADPHNNTKKEVLSFSTYATGATRATEVTSELLKATGFQVAAWYDNTLYFDESAQVAPDGKYDTQGDTYYWPSLSAGNIGFRAFDLASGAVWKTKYESINFTVAEKASVQKDLVIAYAEADKKPEGGIQPLNFTHALSMINFSFKGAEDYTYTINKVEVIAASNAFMSYVNTTDVKQNPDKSDPDGNQPNTGEQKDKVNWTFKASDGTSTAIDGTKALVKSNATKTGSEASQGTLYTYYNSVDSADAKKAGMVVDGTNTSNMNANFMLLPQKGKIAIRIYYKVTDGNDLKGNCGYYATAGDGSHNETNNSSFVGVYGCKTLIIDLGSDKDDNSNTISGWEAGKAYRYTITLPTDNFLGDGANGNTPDGVPDGLDGTTDLDGDGDTDESEFGMDEGGYIEFSVKVYTWDENKKNVNIVIQ